MKSSAIAAVSLSLLACAVPSARAQQPVTAPAAAAAKMPPYKPVVAVSWIKIPAEQVAAHISRVTGATVLVTGSLATIPVTLNTGGGPIDTVLPKVVANMPKGTRVRAVFVPAPLTDAPVLGDSVSAYLRATEALLNPPPKVALKMAPASHIAPPAFAAGMWEISGLQLPLEKAALVASGLSLRPVYLIELPRADEDPVSAMGQLQSDGLRLMMSMTPEQRAQAATNQFAALMNMPSADRQALLTQMMSQGPQMMQAIQSMPADQQKSFMNDIQAALKNSGMIPPGGAPGNGGPGK